jgi:hypothetical protein
MDASEGTCFNSWEDLRDAVEDWAIRDQFEFQTLKKDKSRASYACCHKHSGCQWQLMASYNDDRKIEIKKLDRDHSCAGLAVRNGNTANQQSWLRRVVPNNLFVTRATTPQEIIDSIRMHHAQTPSYKAAWLARQSLINDRREHQVQQFQQIPAYIAQLKKANPGVATDIQFEPNTESKEQTFQRLFICPDESRSSFTHMRKFMAVDGTFLKARFVQTLLFAVGIDANGQNLILAWSIVESENTNSWTWFLQHLKATIPLSVGMTMISDRDKGLLAAQEDVYGNSIYNHICCFHLMGIYEHGAKIIT